MRMIIWGNKHLPPWWLVTALVQCHHVKWKTGHVLLELYRLPLSSGFKEPRHLMALLTRSPEHRVQVFLSSLFFTVIPHLRLAFVECRDLWPRNYCQSADSSVAHLVSGIVVCLGVVLACVLYYNFTRNMWPLMAVPRNPQILCPPNRTMSTWWRDVEHYGSCTRWRYCDPSVT